MAARRRDYAAENERRYARLRAEGFSQSEARGHPRSWELGVSLTRTLRKSSCATILPYTDERGRQMVAIYVEDFDGVGRTSSHEASTRFLLNLNKLIAELDLPECSP